MNPIVAGVFGFFLGGLAVGIADTFYLSRVKKIHLEELRDAAMAARRAVLAREGDIIP